MKAAIFKSKGNIELGDRPDPKIQDQTDAVVRVVRGCVCGSDLWYYRGINPHKEGSIGHEFIGIVDQVGSSVDNLTKGDFVVAPFKFSDGTCINCASGVPTSCLHGGGFGDGDSDGGQGEFVRVPFADNTLIKVPGTDHSDETLASLMALSDVMCTGYHAAVSADIKDGDTVAVIGDGAVGLCAIIGAKRLGAKRIIALSRNPARQKLAKEFGATDIVPERGDEATQAVLKLVDNGVGVDGVLECVGTNESMATAVAIARPGSTIGVVGHPAHVDVPFGDMFFKNVSLRGGIAPARLYIPELLPDVLDGTINPGLVFDFETDLEHIKEAYDAMDERRAIKSILRVSEP
jgi:threonine dehydrogenase-like Zn-dependent dehydrogenase